MSNMLTATESDWQDVSMDLNEQMFFIVLHPFIGHPPLQACGHNMSVSTGSC